MKHYDYLVVGAGLFGSVFAYEAEQRGKTVLVIDRRDHIAGNIYTKPIHGINVHMYGAHIFHTNNEKVWEYINRFARFNHYVNSPIAIYKDELYNLPFNMNTFSKMWGIKTPAEAKAKIAEQIADLDITEPKNLEEQALSLAGRDVYEKLVKGYTEKQWGRDCKDLPAFIIRRLPLRFTFDNNYFNAAHQGIPIGGYTQIIERMLDNVDVCLEQDFAALRDSGKLHTGEEVSYDRILYTGQIDEYYDMKFGPLSYRSLRFETEEYDMDNFQGNAVVNYTEREVPYTRIIEHKHFEFGTEGTTVVTKEYPDVWEPGKEPYYPINDEANSELYIKYRELAKQDDNVIFGGRLGQYKYYDMDQVIAEALTLAEDEF